jgi:hypothetical protein
MISLFFFFQIKRGGFFAAPSNRARAESKRRSERTAVSAEAYFIRRGMLFPRKPFNSQNFHDLLSLVFIQAQQNR